MSYGEIIRDSIEDHIKETFEQQYGAGSYSYPVWRTRKGELIPIRIMSTDHIENTINYLNRNNFISLRIYMNYMYANTKDMGDGAQDAFDREFSIITEKNPSIWLDLMHDELVRRGVQI